MKRQKTLLGKVISIGNITTGGTGKTPLVIALAEEALKRGLKPCILTRGYKGRLRGPCFVSKGEEALISPFDAGDEPSLMAQRLKGVPIVKAVDRYEGGMFAIKELNPENQFLFILDDGFQHWRLKRDKDILLINSGEPFGGEKLLPVGCLREPLKELNRADIIVITNPELSSGLSDIISEVKRYNPSAPLFLAEHKPSYIGRVEGVTAPISWLNGKNVYAFCGIAYPHSFRTTLRKTGSLIKGFRSYRDHYRFKQHEIRLIEKEALRCNAEWIITTEKDIIRLRGIKLPENLVFLGIELSASDGFYEEVFKGF